jgi:uncharacterized protein (DUF1501 family)
VRPVSRAELLAGVSRPAGLFSHSDQQRAWQLAAKASEARGWGGRLADELAASNAGSKAPGSVSIAGPTTFAPRRAV